MNNELKAERIESHIKCNLMDFTRNTEAGKAYERKNNVRIYTERPDGTETRWVGAWRVIVYNTRSGKPVGRRLTAFPAWLEGKK